MNTFILMIGYSSRLVGTEYLRVLTQLMGEISLPPELIPSPSINPKITDHTKPTTISVELANDHMSVNVRSVIDLIELHKALGDYAYINLSVVKIIGDKIFDAWTLPDARVASLLVDEDRSPSGRLVFTNAIHLLHDRSKRTLDVLNAYYNPDDTSNIVQFYEIEHELMISENDLKALENAKDNPLETNPVLKAAFEKRRQKMIDSINEAKDKADAEVTDPVQKSFLKRLREIIGI